MKKRTMFSVALTFTLLAGNMASAANNSTYTVKSGDTLWSISQKLNVSLANILAANPQVNPNNMYVGLTINIPAVESAAASGTTSASNVNTTTNNTYTVQAGDNFWLISQKLKIDWNSLVAANPNVNPNNIYAGLIINLPVGQAVTSSGNTSNATNSSNNNTNTNTNTNSDSSSNNLTNTGSSAKTTNNTYTVQSGDNFWMISQKLKINWNSLVAANPNVNPNNMYAGLIINLPVGQAATNTGSTSNVTSTANTSATNSSTANTSATNSSTTGVTTNSNNSNAANTMGNTYTVQSGDNFWVISQKLNISWSSLVAANPNVDAANMYVGMKINLPTGVAQTATSNSGTTTAGTGSTPADAVVTAPLYLADGQFPLKPGTYTPFIDTYGDGRSFNPDGTQERLHEGNDIMAAKGTPIYSAYDGTVINKGWNTLGGWRLTVQTPDGKTALYYAHMSAYASGTDIGSAIKKGQLIGYVGNTGYGPEGTEGLFDPHLHFGMYDMTNGFTAVDPYNNLKYWEKISLTAKY